MTRNQTICVLGLVWVGLMSFAVWTDGKTKAYQADRDHELQLKQLETQAVIQKCACGAGAEASADQGTP